MDPFGDYAAKLRDPYGHEWLVSTRVESLTVEEIAERFAQLMAGG